MTTDDALEIWEAEQPEEPGELTIASKAEVKIR